MTQRRGFTLIEVLLALVIMSLVTGAIYQLLNTNQRLALAQAEQVSLQSNVRTGSLVVPNELRELNTVLGSADPTQNDVRVNDADGVTYRAMRGLGFVCQSAANQLLIRQSTWNGARDPSATRDSLFLFVDGDPDEDALDRWWPAEITAVGNAVCPGAGGGAAYQLSITPAMPIVPVGTPIRVYELMRLQLQQDGAEWWLQARSVRPNDQLQKVLGPLTSNGFQLQYLNSAGNAAASLDAIASIRVTVRGLTDDAVRAGGTAALGHLQEALATQVLLRNSIRP